MAATSHTATLSAPMPEASEDGVPTVPRLKEAWRFGIIHTPDPRKGGPRLGEGPGPGRALTAPPTLPSAQAASGLRHVRRGQKSF